MKLIVVNWLRFFAIVSILIWHCIVCPAVGWGLLPESFYTKIVGIFGKLFIPEANMPLFTALSGYLFAHLFYKKKNNYTCFTSIVKNKFNRLVVPFLVLGSLATLVVPERPFVSGMIWGDGSSLWFCMMLFWCTIIRSAVLFYNDKKNIIGGGILLLSIAVILIFHSNYDCPKVLFHIPVGILCFSRAVYFYAFFVLGDWLYKSKNRVSRLGVKFHLLLFFVYIALFYLVEFHNVLFLKGLASLPYILLVFLFFWRLYEKGLLIDKKWLDTFCKYSFGLYVFHEPIAWICYHNDNLLECYRYYPFIYSISFTLVVFLFCFSLTHFCLKTKIGNYLLK